MAHQVRWCDDSLAFCNPALATTSLLHLNRAVALAIIFEAKFFRAKLQAYGFQPAALKSYRSLPKRQQCSLFLVWNDTRSSAKTNHRVTFLISF